MFEGDPVALTDAGLFVEGNGRRDRGLDTDAAKAHDGGEDREQFTHGGPRLRTRQGYELTSPSFFRDSTATEMS